MKTMRLSIAALVIAGAWAAVGSASDPTALYARVDRVVVQPSADQPRTIQIWGVFSMARPDDRNDYLPPARGYLFFTLAGAPEAARKEWADLQQVAGTRQIVSFGSRYDLRARLRTADEPPASPDPYVVSMGLTKVNGRTDYAPVRALVDFKD